MFIRRLCAVCLFCGKPFAFMEGFFALIHDMVGAVKERNRGFQLVELGAAVAECDRIGHEREMLRREPVERLLHRFLCKLLVTVENDRELLAAVAEDVAVRAADLLQHIRERNEDDVAVGMS